MLMILLYVTSGHDINKIISAGCCILISISDIAILFLLERMECTALEREQLLTLNQQIQLQSKSMASASELYSAQQKKVHDFRAHLNVLRSPNEKIKTMLQLRNILKKSPSSKLTVSFLSTHIMQF